MSLNPNLSNGTCYYASGRQSNSRFIPCGNVAFGQTWCCQSGDMCLVDHACYNPQYGVTYIAGCTDSTYSDGSCPNKVSNSNSPWSGLTYCNGTASTTNYCQSQNGNLVCGAGPAAAWFACPDTASTVSRPAQCACPTTTKTVAFNAGSILNNVASLPTTSGGTISWAPGYGSFATTPTAASSSASSSASSFSSSASAATSSPGSSLTSSAASTSSSASASATAVANSGLSTGAKVGIGVGVGGGASLLVLFLAFFLWYRRRHQRIPKVVEPDDHSGTGAGLATSKSTKSNSKRDSLNDPNNRLSAFSGFKAELPAESEKGDSPTGTSKSPWLSGTVSQNGSSSELPGSPAPGGESRQTRDGGHEIAGHRGTLYEMPG